MEEKKKLLLSIGLVLILVLMIVGISYAAFKFAGPGSKVSTITSGIMKMSYTEGDNIINLQGALPTTDATGKKRLNEGEYFDFTVSSTIKGSANINWEIALEEIWPEDGERQFDGSYIKLYLTELDDSGNETPVLEPVILFDLDYDANEYTGKPEDIDTLYSTSTNKSFSKKYRLRMWVDEDYNPQGDGGNLQFGVKVNVYGKAGDKLLSLRKKVLADNELQVEKAHMFNYTSNGLTSGSTTPDSNYVTTGLYSTEDEDGTSYYYRGNVVNNNVQFGEYQEDYYVYKYDNQYFQSLETCQSYNSSCSESNTTKVKLASKGDKMYWKIVRINGDGSARLIYNGTNPTATYDENDLSTWSHIGVTYYSKGSTGSYESVGYTDNGTDSLIKTQLDTWYSNTLEINDKIVAKEFCNDTSFIENDEGKWNGYKRLSQSDNSFAIDNSPSLICPETSENYGGSYNLKVGLITADELTLGGELYSVESDSYLNSNSAYWSMTPVKRFNSYVYLIFGNGSTSDYTNSLSWYNIKGSWLGIRPVINVSGGVVPETDGTVDNPYIIK